MLTQKGLVDSLRWLEADAVSYSYIHDRERKYYSRLDYIYVAQPLTDTLVSYTTNTHTITRSDHFPIWIQITHASTESGQDEAPRPNMKAPPQTMGKMERRDSTLR